MPLCCCTCDNRSRICVRSVTSSAVVGSSASSRCGRPDSAIAIIARCRWPPESWCGKASARRSGSGMPVARRASTAASHASRLPSPSLSCSTSAIWSPTVYSGFSAVIGSWKIIAISRPRTASSSRSGSASRSRGFSPSLAEKSADPLTAALGTRPSRLSALTVLPDPDSPTSASFSPRATEKSMPCTTSLPPKATRKPRTSSSALMHPPFGDRGRRAMRRPSGSAAAA